MLCGQTMSVEVYGDFIFFRICFALSSKIWYQVCSYKLTGHKMGRKLLVSTPSYLAWVVLLIFLGVFFCGFISICQFV